jgi:peroxiredoxin Q/BCP
MSAFRDQLAEKFADIHAQVLGVSTDDAETNKKFAESLKLPFPLLSDPEGKVVKEYGVAMEHGGKTLAQRVTFVIDKEGNVTKVLEGKDALDPSPALQSCPLRKKS